MSMTQFQSPARSPLAAALPAHAPARPPSQVQGQGQAQAQAQVQTASAVFAKKMSKNMVAVALVTAIFAFKAASDQNLERAMVAAPAIDYGAPLSGAHLD